MPRFDKKTATGYVERLLNLHEKLDDLKVEHMNSAKEVRGDMKEVFDEAKGDGITKPALAAKIKERLLGAKLEAVREELDAEEVEIFDALSLALGDLEGTPLGESARKGAKGKGMPSSATPH